MTGIVGGTTVDGSLEAMADSLRHEAWYETDFFEDGDPGFGLVHHGARDPRGHAVWDDGARVGVLHGTLTNRGSLADDASVLEAALDDPTAVLPQLDGPFALACADQDAERLVVATDKLATRPCYYTTAGGATSGGGELTFGSELKAVLARLDDPTVNERAVSDLVLMGYLWGEKTLLEGVSALPPATVLTCGDGAIRTERYWKADFTPSPTEGYVEELAKRYRTMLADAAATMTGSVGLWLSGGLDSRTMAGELRRNARREDGIDAVRAYTYDLNPKDAGNPALARRVANRLGIAIDEVEQTPDRFLEHARDAVRRTDGMITWRSTVNAGSAFALGDDRPNVFLEGAGQGEFIGNHLRRRHLTAFDSAAESMYHSERLTTVADAKRVLAVDVDPFATFRDAAARSDEPTVARRIVDAHYDNYYSRATLANDNLLRSLGGTRVPFPHGEFLEHVARLPPAYRMRTLPLTRGRIPYAVTPAKLGLVGALDPEMGTIPYERTGVPPRYPLAIHVAGFVAKTSLSRLRSRTTYGGASVVDEWYRNHTGFREFLDDLLENAGERPYFDADDLRRRRREHLAGDANHVYGVLSAVSTVEIWLQEFVD